MPTYRYLHYDVFTETKLEGNQLAVFPEPGGLSADEMQRVAREMNFSESTFIFPPEAVGTDGRMRIFTPGEELPIAGHPTIGTTFALVREGTIKPEQARFVFGCGVGPVPVSLDWKGKALDFAWMTMPNPTFGPEVKFTGVPPGMKGNRPPSAGLQFFGTLAAAAGTKVLTVRLHNLAGDVIYNVDLPPA